VPGKNINQFPAIVTFGQLDVLGNSFFCLVKRNGLLPPFRLMPMGLIVANALAGKPLPLLHPVYARRYRWLFELLLRIAFYNHVIITGQTS
jgi:hypothetical protein